jgi:glycosyl hydrolase family 106( putative alpha-L-rhamnosidase)
VEREFITSVSLLLIGMLATVAAGDPDFSDPAVQPAPQAGALGYPSRASDLDVLPGFRNPPPGYGQVPFWWWSGEDLDVDRMIAQIRELHRNGISGVQVNYSHYDTRGWMTDQKQPPIFSEAWWDVYGRISQVCGELDMGIGLSTYTLDWPRGAPNLFYHLFYSKPELNAIELVTAPRQRVRGGETKTLVCPSGLVTAHAYPVVKDRLQWGGVDLTPFVREGQLTWTAPPGEWELWTFRAVRKGGSLNPLMTGSGNTVIRGFFQPFQDHNPDKSSKGLNYFFNDELHIGLDKFAWNPDFPEEFRRRKGYDLFEVLPAMWQDLGPITPKVRMDYADVRMSLMEERYFKPIYEWHASRGMIFGCDSGGRGTRPNEFGDYFRATRWYTAPGHDTPGGNADLVKGKVSSSIANLYRRPRVWLEGYHSLGWGATPEQLMLATRENYLYGCTLLNLHGLYYSTFGSHWEWAPPCYHFRMPYWEHMDEFLKYFERLSYLLSQGHLVTDVAVVYPVAPYEAEMDGDKSKETAFTLAERLMSAGINFEFIDNDSLARAIVEDRRLVVRAAGSSYQALILPNMDAVRWPTIEQAAAFAKAGGRVYSVGSLPTASDRAGRDDPVLEAMNERLFKPECRYAEPDAAVDAIRSSFVQDVSCIDRTVRAFHRKAGPRDVYFVMDATPGTIVEFRAKGAVEQWDAWTGETRPLRVVEETATGTQVELPLEAYEAQIVVFTPGRQHVNPPGVGDRVERQRTLSREWTAAFVPTMDNAYGDFRFPVTADNRRIGVEARRFTWARETESIARTAMLPATDDRAWETKLHGFGTRFYALGPVADNVETEQLETKLAQLATVDPAVPVNVAGRDLSWKPYDFSWRYGKEDDAGHQGYHGLKGTITDDFICLGKAVGGLNETRYVDEDGGRRYYLWTVATVNEPLSADILVSRGAPTDKSHTSPVLTPAAVYVNGKRISNLGRPVALNAGTNPTLIRYDHPGRGHFVLRRASSPPTAPAKLAMRWHGDPAVIPLDVSSGAPVAEWFRFLSAPGTTAIRVRALGQAQAWIDGKPMARARDGRFAASEPSPTAAIVALRVVPQIGSTGGAAIPEPVVVETDGNGLLTLGDWSQLGILNNYSGGVRYRTNFTLTKDDAKAHVTVDLGRVVATAEVHLNGNRIGVRVAPPWRFDATGLMKPGDNRLEVLVYSTLANHYQTIPSRYRGNPEAGLFGPVRLLSHDWGTGEAALNGDPKGHNRRIALPRSLAR